MSFNLNERIYLKDSNRMSYDISIKFEHIVLKPIVYFWANLIFLHRYVSERKTKIIIIFFGKILYRDLKSDISPLKTQL